MGQALDHAVDSLLGTVGIGGYSIADLHDGAPVLGREVFVGCLVWARAWCQHKCEYIDVEVNILMASS